MKQLDIVILGPPGAGKGTQADMVAGKYHIPHISTGDIFRRILKDDSPLAIQVRAYVEKGKLVPDRLVTEIVRKRLKNEDTKNGFIIDGFPRTRNQARDFDQMLKEEERTLKLVIYLDTSFDILLERLSGRRVCLHCGANYHIVNSPPQEEGVCDRCGGQLYQREDDRIETIKKRYEVYLQQTEEIIGYYKKKKILFKVSGDLAKDEIFHKITAKIEQLNHF